MQTGSTKKGLGLKGILENGLCVEEGVEGDKGALRSFDTDVTAKQTGEQPGRYYGRGGNRRPTRRHRSARNGATQLQERVPRFYTGCTMKQVPSALRRVEAIEEIGLRLPIIFIVG